MPVREPKYKPLAPGAQRAMGGIMEHRTPSPPIAATALAAPLPAPAQEIGGSKKPEPTRYGDWEIGGKCVDF